MGNTPKLRVLAVKEEPQWEDMIVNVVKNHFHKVWATQAIPVKEKEERKVLDTEGTNPETLGQARNVLTVASSDMDR